jgi:hypothetical protein
VSPDDRRLARRLDREARAAEKVNARALRTHAKAVARRDRLVQSARERLPRQAVITAAAVGGAVAWHAEALYLVAAVFGVRGLRSAVHLLHSPPVPPVPVQPAAACPPPPPVGSAAFPAVRRLESVRVELLRLVPLVAPVGVDAAEEAWRAAAEADVALRWQAARLAAVEPHRGAEPALLEQLLAGVAAQERLVAGLADLVAASADPIATLRLQDATDALHALAMGLRELQ